MYANQFKNLPVSKTHSCCLEEKYSECAPINWSL